ncbi:hypothetical protein [Pseudoalteromonas sp. MMG022]|uniref:hypothetical protein n=1 Tax=Pseudoalteromonas sp. MMG022 TaxID=2909978 RepID=UPI001F3902F1|nr:hypothetical protein [Pseudoalteromonas sp. MMG022]MCF6435790.1 hypothetical protein [Pseudoalteromonas sp. MMG022]
MVNTKKSIKIALLAMLISWASPLLAHGLQMTTAQVVQRQDSYLFITIHTSVAKLYQQMSYQDKPASMMHLANGSEQQLGQFREALFELFRNNMNMSVAQQPLHSVKIRIATSAELKKLLHSALAEQVLSSQHHEQSHHAERKNYLRVEVDGFIAASHDTSRVLSASFPKELGQVLVSYTKPQIQTLTPSANGSQYIQALWK